MTKGPNAVEDAQKLREGQRQESLVQESLRAERKFDRIIQRGIGDQIVEDYFVRGQPIPGLAQKYGIDKNTLYEWIIDHQQKNYSDQRVNEVALMDMTSHISVIGNFLATAHYNAREAAFTALFARRVREEIAASINEHGFRYTLQDKELMDAWQISERKLIAFSNLSPKFMDSYIKLMEQVLDKQKDMAFVKVVYDVMGELDPKLAKKLQDRLQNDEYARAVMESMSGEQLIAVFKQRGLKTLVPETHILPEVKELEAVQEPE